MSSAGKAPKNSVRQIHDLGRICTFGCTRTQSRPSDAKFSHRYPCQLDDANDAIMDSLVISKSAESQSRTDGKQPRCPMSVLRRLDRVHPPSGAIPDTWWAASCTTHDKG